MFFLTYISEGYCGTANAAEKATTSSAGSSLHPRLSPLPSSIASQQPPASARASASASPSSVPQPHPTSTAVSVKQEVCHLQNTQCAKAVSSSTEAPQVHSNQPVSFFPSSLLPPLLLNPLHLAAPTSSAASTSVNSLPTAESSARQQEGEGLKDCVKVRSTKEQAKPAKRESEDETLGNPGKEEVKGKAAAGNSFPEREKKASAVSLDSDDGNESDDSVKMMEPSNPVVIDIEESDSEEAHETVPDGPVPSESPQVSVSVEFTSVSSQTSQQVEDDK